MFRRAAGNPVLRKLVETLVTLLGVAIVVFIMLRAIPGDQIGANLGTEAAALTPGQRLELEHYYGLDQPLVVQFFSWLGNVLTGNLGFSAQAQQSVATMTAHSLPVTFELAVLAIIIGLVIGIPLGMLSSSRPNTGWDAASQGVGLAGLSVPAFLLAAAILAIAAQYLHFNPNGQGYATLFENPGLNLQQMLMPAIVLGFGLAAPIMRTARTALLELRQQDFVRTARGKGVPKLRIQFVHVLKNALVPIVTMTGLQFGYLLGGAVVVEQIFSIPGIGRQVLNGINDKEYAVVQSSVLVIALVFVIVNLLTDIFYRLIDPRVRAA
jgi:peptide/nickel transport system permease protein